MGKKRKKDKDREENEDRGKIDVIKAEKDGVAEVDELFNALTKKKKEKREVEEREHIEQEEQRLKRIADKRELKLMMMNSRGPKEDEVGTIASSGEIISPNPPIHRWDKESGLPVYKCKALKTEDGGGTPLCPFDCNCCF